MRTIYRQQVYRAEDIVEGEARMREGAAPLVDALVTVCVAERDTFKPVSLRRTFPDLYAKYESVVEEGQ